MDNEDIRWIALGFCLGTLGIMYLVNPAIAKFALVAILITLPLSFSSSI